MMKRLYLLATGLFIICTTTFSAIEPVNHRIQGSDLYDLNASGTFDLADNKFWMVDAGFWHTQFAIQSVNNKIIFGIDESDLAYHGTEYSFRITFDVDYKELVNGSLVNKDFNAVELHVNYDPARGVSYQDRDLFVFTGGLEVVISEVEIEFESVIGANDWELVDDPSELFSAIYLETEIITERYYHFDTQDIPSTNVTINVVGDEAEVSWPFMTGAEEYDLEWAWVSRYSADANGDLQLLNAPDVFYNFNLNATRVRLKGQNTYRIPLIYGHGYLVVRYRGIGRAGVNYTIPMEGSWSSAGSGFVNWAPNYLLLLFSHEDDEINYGAGMSFIENGVRSVGVTYMDGVLKPRQSQAKLNGQDKIIVGSTIYDYHGRPAIGVMSTPVDQSFLGYVDELNMYDDGVTAVPYEKQNFDVDQLVMVCGSMDPAPPIDPVSSTGASHYYSPENTDIEGYNAYLPDAEGYPFVQVQYTPDPTGRIKKVGGVGANHQLGDTDDGDAHYTEYFYTTPDDDELWALFGNDAARPVNYTKVITKDVHGQFSIALIDGMGRTVATYLEGYAPIGLEEIEGNIGMTPTGKDFMPYNQNFEPGVLQVQTPITVLDPDVIYTFNYDFTGVTFDECLPENICYDCIYELEITILPGQLTACEMTDGAEIDPVEISTDGFFKKTFVVGNIESFDTDCDDPLVFSEEFPGDESFTVKFGETGEYYVIKTLKVSEAPIDYYWEQYQDQSTCLLTYEDFFANSLASVDWTQCEEYDPCEFNFLLEHGNVGVWLENNPTMDTTDYDDLKAEYLADCGTISSCDMILPMLILDMSPGGQYGSTTLSDDLSIYNESNIAFGADWKDVTYHNADGSISYVDSDNDLIEDDLPTTLSITEFFNHWQPSWAMDLIQYHPEYCYYEFCLTNPEIADFEQDLFAIETFEEACSLGYINPAEAAGYFDLAACTTNVADPVFDLVISSDQSAVDAIMNAEYDDYSIYEMAVVMSGDDPGTVAFGSGCNETEHWKNFRILYMSKRFQVIEILKAAYADEHCPGAPCVGSSEPACSTSVFNTSLKRYFTYESVMGYDLSYLGTTDWEAGADDAELNVEAHCLDMCESQAVNWMQQLVGCEDQLISETWNPGQTTYDYIYDELIEICAGGCIGGCFTLTQEDPSVSSDPGNDIYASFEELIDYNFDLTETCTYLLITNPLPGSCADLGPYYLDGCNCNMLLGAANKEEFTELYGYTPENFEGDSCKCAGFDTDIVNGILEGTELTAAYAAELTTTTNYVCPEVCIRCEQLTATGYGQIDQFETTYGVAYYEAPAMFTVYVNEAVQSNFTYEELLDFIENCEALFTGVDEPMYNFIGPKAYKIKTLLTELNADDLTTSDSYNHTQLPEYFYSGLYSCTDQATATFNYSPTLTSNVLDFDMMGEGCTGTCNVSIDIVGGFPGSISSATEYYQNIISFDEIFVTDTDLSPSILNIFHINVTLNDLSGGTLSGELLVTSCYDIFHILETSTAIGIVSDLWLCPQPVVAEGDPCMENLIAEAELDAQAQYEAYLDTQYDLFVANYKNTCTQITDETFYMDYEANRYHYTLLWYDLSGNLVRTVPPKGVNKLNATEIDDAIDFANGLGTAVYPAHTFNTFYKHNSLNQVVEVTTPDGGTSKFWYDNIGRLAVSQDAKQDQGHYLYGVDLYSYTKYDELGRVYEVGEVMNNEPMTIALAKDPVDLLEWIDSDYSNSYLALRDYITRIHYDEPFSQLAADEFKVSNADELYNPSGYGHTRNRITAVELLVGYINTSYEWVAPQAKSANHYRYDIHGNVQSYLQDISELRLHENQYRRTDYEYDLISGNPNYIYYQKGKPDQSIHHYNYDFDNRLKEVWTSNDGQVWDRDVNYEYREDGYLARTELGEMKVQGMDYAYTLHGWIKSLNSGVLNADYDMGKDGKTNPTAEYDFYEDDVHALHARDALSYTVGYYNNDYKQITDGVSGYSNMMTAFSGAIATDIDELFNGNITSYMASTTDTDGDKLDPLAIAYHYDQLHRFKESHVFTYTDITSSNSTLNAVRNNVSAGLGDYEMYVDYDMNGNIDSLARRSYGASNSMDLFKYHYTSGTNKLHKVTDAETGTGSSGYGDIQHGQSNDNYSYWANGALKADIQEDIANIEWYPNGLVKRIYRNGTSQQSDLYFEYDAMGNRILKVEMTRDVIYDIQPEHLWTYTYYATDANGITMAVYELDSDDVDPTVVTKIEQMLYGGSRLGMETTAIVVSDAADYVNDCNNDGLASGIVQLGATAPANGVVVEILLDAYIAADIVWNTSNTIQEHGQSLVNDINAQASGYYAEMIDMSTYVYIRLKELVAGSLQSQVLNVELDHVAAPTYVQREITIGDCYENRTLGKKFYELSNYLGNVMEVISDRKIAHNNAGTIDYFEADIVSYSDYYPYGMEMPGRKGTASYRYAYNGMEVDPEVSGNGNSYTTQFRQYDPRLGRWKSLDPLAGKYPDLSPFAAFNNNPIYFTDPLGLEGEGSNEGGPEGSGTKADPYKVDNYESGYKELDGIDKPINGQTVYFTNGQTTAKATYNKEKGVWETSWGSSKANESTWNKGGDIEAGQNTSVAQNAGTTKTTATNTSGTTETKSSSTSNGPTNSSSSNQSQKKDGYQHQRIFTDEQSNLNAFFGVPITLGQMTGNLSSFESLIADGEIVAKFIPETGNFGIFKNGVLTQTIDIPSGVNFQSSAASLKAVKSLSITCKYVGGVLSYLSVGMTLDLMLADGVNVENSIDLAMGLVGLSGPYGALVSAAYSLVLKPYFNAVSWGWSQIPSEHLQWAGYGKY